MAARCLSMIVIMAILAIFGGCAHYYYQGESLLEKNWGRSFESAKYNETLNPEPARIWHRLRALTARCRNGPTALLTGEQKKKPDTEFGVMTIKQQAY